MQRERRHGTFVGGRRYRQVYVLATRVCFPENLLGKEEAASVESVVRSSGQFTPSRGMPPQHLAEKEMEGRQGREMETAEIGNRKQETGSSNRGI
jgi:hypothetical protein